VNRRTLARIAAPALFLAGFTIAVLLVRAGLADESATTAATAAPTTATATEPTRTRRATTRRATTRPEPIFATVEAGDTLDEIALEHDTTVERLLALNPNLDPSALQIGQRIRVR